MGFELLPSPHQTQVRTARLKQPRELFHRKPSLSNQRPKSPFGEFFVIWNGEASVGRIGASKNEVAPVLLALPLRPASSAFRFRRARDTLGTLNRLGLYIWRRSAAGECSRCALAHDITYARFNGRAHHI